MFASHGIFFSTLKKSKVSHHGHREVDVKRAESLNSGDSFTDIMSYVRNNAAAWQLSLFFIIEWILLHALSSQWNKALIQQRLLV